MLVAVSLISTLIQAGEYTPPGLYDIDYFELSSGFHVLLKERHDARSVSYRVIVNTGFADYSCGRKETPHFLEHLLFTGTSKYSESELDDLIEEHGGKWNAYTEDERTVYEIDIFSKYAELGLQTLYEILTDSQITQENVDKSRDIIHRESGGKPSIFKQWFYEKGIGAGGYRKAFNHLFEGTPFVCSQLEMADEIKRSDILEAYSRYYKAKNMTLVVVGDFDSVAMNERIEATFGSMESGESNQRQSMQLSLVKEEQLYTSTLSPVFGNEAVVGLAYPWVGSLSVDYYPAWFIENYLSDRLFKYLRISEGVAYSPGADPIMYSDVGALMIYADTEFSDIDKVLTMIQEETDKLINEPLSEKKISQVKNKLLMSIVKGYESNAGIADYYTDSMFEIENTGALIRMEDKIHKLTAADIQRVAQKYLGYQPRIVFQNIPTMTYKQLALYSVIVLLIPVYFIARHFRRISSREG